MHWFSGDKDSLCFPSSVHLSLASFSWDIGKQYSPRYTADGGGVPSGAILFAERNFNQKLNKI